MAYTVTADLQGILSIVQAFDSTSTPGATGGGARLTHNAFNQSLTLPTSTIPVTKAYVTNKAMSGGAATIDLTSLTDISQSAADFSGLKVQALLCYNPASNSPITITEGASNGHSLSASSSSWKVTLPAGAWFLFYGADGGQDVGASDKTWDLSGTTTNALSIAVLAG
ncbi:MAG: hypothetical protein IT366_21590 [Candidatus Hydrogenedentes bacterium]|nr:hypothetical protein [Candidatus Hydrogenedentota bacterium]